jgi:signal transduction histidine kinase
LNLSFGGRESLRGADTGNSLRMARASAKPRRTGAELFLGGIALALVTVVCFQIGAGVAPTAFIYLTVILLLSLRGNFISSAILSVVAVLCLSVFFASRLFDFGIFIPEDIVVISVFLLTTLIVTRLVENLRRRSEALRESEAFLSEAQRLSHTGSFAWHVPSGEISWSDEMFRLFEYDPSTKPSLDLVLQRIHPVDRPSFQHLTSGPRTEVSVGEDEFRLLMPDGRIKHIRALRTTGSEEYARTSTLVGSVMDVTQRKRAEEALRQAQADLARVSRVTTMGELTANLAHEVNQPITAAVTNANACLRWLAADTPNLEEARAAARRIVNDGTRAAEIVSRTRQVFEKGAPDREPVDIDNVIRETITLLSGEAVRHAISVRQLLAAGFPEVMGDRIQLQQVVMNLIMNSIEALKEVEGARELVVKSQRSGDDEVLVSVSDSGVGLPPQGPEQLFDTFFTTKPHGTGMGLSISRSIVEAHGGRLWAEPREPRGAVFQFTLSTAAEPPHA